MNKLKNIKNIIIQASEIGLSYFGKVEKKIKEDLSIVTVADKEIEVFLKTKILELYPNDGFIGEEEGTQYGSSGDIWIIDPIDGTADFSNSLPSWGLSIALLRNSEIIEAVVYIPISKSYYYAQKDGGSYKNDQRIYVRTGEFTKSNYFATNAGTHLILNMSLNLRVTTYPSALNPCLVADGSVLGSISPAFYIWDFAASYLIAKEANAKIEYLNSGEFNIIEVLDSKVAKDFVLFGSSEFISYARNNCKIK